MTELQGEALGELASVTPESFQVALDAAEQLKAEAAQQEVTRADLEQQLEKPADKEWTTEALLLAAIVNNSGGFMRITQKQLSRVHGLAIQVDPRTKDVLIYVNGERKRRK